MNKRTLHRPLALLLALAMTLTLFSVPALATDGDAGSTPSTKSATSVKVEGKRLNSGENYKGATFSNGTLTLNGYTGGGISASGGDLTIVVKGANRINEPDTWGIQCWDGKLTIQGETAGSKTGSLTIHSKNTALMSYAGALTVKDLKTLSCSSTTDRNPIIHVMRGQDGMTFSNIGTMLVRGNTSYGGAIASSNPMNFTSVDTLEVLNDNNNAIAAYGGLNIDDNCGTVLVLSKQKDGIYTYGTDVTIKATRLIAIGKEYGVEAYYGNKTINLSGVSSMLLYGQTAAMYQSSATIKLPEAKPYSGGTTYTFPADTSSFKNANISITTDENNTVSEIYTGNPVTVAASAVDDENNAITETMTYIYAWYDSTGKIPLMEAPTDVGTYTVKVYGFSDTYYSNFREPATATVTITATDAPDTYERTLTGTIGNGYNIYDLPEIPEGMSYGTPTDVTTGLTASVAGGKLSVSATDIQNNSNCTVKVPVKQATNKNYNEYVITYTLTAVTNARFDLCDDSTPKDIPINDFKTSIKTTLSKVKDDGGAWGSDIDTAEEFGYTFDGWYTAPNGWGDQITDKDGNYLKDNEGQDKAFQTAHTYFAHWVATRAVAGYVGNDNNLKLAYVQFANNERRTVYTTGLDFTQADAMGDHTTGYGYVWDKTNNTLTLDGVLINSGTSSPALTLPVGATIHLEEDTRLTSATTYYTEKNQELENVEIPAGAKASAYNNICGGVGEIPSLMVGSLNTLMRAAPTADSGLTITSEDAGCSLSVRGGAASVTGNLNLETDALLSAPGIYVDGNVTLAEDAMLVTVDPEQVKTTELDLSVAGNLNSSGGTLVVDGDVTADKINLTNSTLMSWGALQANAITLSQLSANSFCDSLDSNSGTITLDNTTMSLDGEDALIAAALAQNLTVKNGSELTITDYMTCGVIANQMTVSNSTVKIRKATDKDNANQKAYAALLLVNSTANPNLTLERARITEPSSVSMEQYNDIAQVAKNGDEIVRELTITPYHHSSSSGSSNYAVTVAETKNGTVTPSATRVGSGSTVTLTVAPDGGYVLDGITVKTADGKDVSLTKAADGKYTFKMPSSAVTVNAAFRLRFTDLDPNAWYFDGVKDSLKKGLMEGMSETIFAPNGTLTRAQLVTILWRMEQQPSVDYALPFTDVAAGQWYTEAVRWAAAENVVNGTSATTFTPDAPVTREQLVTMLWRYAKQKGYDVSIGEETNILSYADATSVSEYAIPAMQWACGAGVIQGADGKLLPKDSTTRAQIATIFQRFGTLKA